ncbi:hypothetical protein [Pseudooceanicola nanhaiensis]|uniref:hypothetical protein n=1 Tax=Pseudooceanicola nanhaiensis TaxID=375761 RepID=UPI0035112A34
MFSGIDIIAVSPGTEIEHEGEKLTVTETQAVHKGRCIYMTEKQVAALKAHPSVKVESR